MLLTGTIPTFAQETDGVYFPREQIIHPDCKDAKDKNQCLYQLLEEQISQILQQKKSLKILSKMKQDTILASLRVVFEDYGNVKESELSVYHGKKLMDASKKAIRTLMSNLPEVDIQNRKPNPIESTHTFYFKYFFDGNKDESKLHSIPTKKSYKGGIVEEIPVFPSCKELPQKEARACFQNMMKKHISNHFRYPEAAVQKGISGIVHTTMIIDKKGEFTKIKVKGDHHILELEALRILNLLPKIFPGLQNGKPVSFPYSIPITFRLGHDKPKKM